MNTADAFELAYGRGPTTDEIARLEPFVAGIGPADNAGLVRAAVAAFDRYNHPTPFTVRFRQQDVVTSRIAGSDVSVILDRYDPVMTGATAAAGGYEPHLARFLDQAVKPGMVVVDIGANVGFHALRIAAAVGATGHVHAFEPNSENCRMILLSVARNRLGNLTLYPVALSDRNGAAFFSPALGSNGGFLDGAEATLMHVNCCVVPTVRLDGFLATDRLDLIKIDVEGAEALALAGATALIERHRPIITTEFSVEMLGRVSGVGGADYLRRFVALGYRITTLGLSGPVEDATDVDRFLSGWGSLTRIEDLALVPTGSALRPDGDGRWSTG